MRGSGHRRQGQPLFSVQHPVFPLRFFARAVLQHRVMTAAWQHRWSAAFLQCRKRMGALPHREKTGVSPHRERMGVLPHRVRMGVLPHWEKTGASPRRRRVAACPAADSGGELPLELPARLPAWQRAEPDSLPRIPKRIYCQSLTDPSDRKNPDCSFHPSVTLHPLPEHFIHGDGSGG